jgi:5-methylcytosine-specific restriction enzyme A
MPRRPPTACGHPACPNPRPCPLHPASWGTGARGRTMPPGWGKTRATVLRRDPTCRLCLAAPSTEVHHAAPPSEDPADLLGVCAPCHRAETQRQAVAARLASR